MANYLTAEDLTNFLRSRQSYDCKLAADWAAGNPEHPAVAQAVEMLEGYVLRLAECEEMRQASLALNGGWSVLKAHCILACLILVAPRYKYKRSNAIPGWQSLVEAAKKPFGRQSPAWAAQLSRWLRAASVMPEQAAAIAN